MILIHEGCSENSGTQSKSSGTSSVTSLDSSERKDISSEKTTKSSERTEISSETASKSSERKRKSSERILNLIKNKPTISAAEIAMEIDMSSRGVEKQIKKLREAGIIKRNGADFGGYWEIVNLDND